MKKKKKRNASTGDAHQQIVKAHTGPAIKEFLS